MTVTEQLWCCALPCHMHVIVFITVVDLLTSAVIASMGEVFSWFKVLLCLGVLHLQRASLRGSVRSITQLVWLTRVLIVAALVSVVLPTRAGRDDDEDENDDDEEAEEDGSLKFVKMIRVLRVVGLALMFYELYVYSRWRKALVAGGAAPAVTPGGAAAVPMAVPTVVHVPAGSTPEAAVPVAKEV